MFILWPDFFQGVRLFKGVRLFQTLEYTYVHTHMFAKYSCDLAVWNIYAQKVLKFMYAFACSFVT